MDAWELGGAITAQPTAKRIAVGNDKTVMRALHLIARLSLKNALEVRELQAAVFHTYTVPKSNPYIQAALEATKVYAEKAKASKDGTGQHPPGEPHVHAWAAMLRVALEDPALNSDDKQCIEAHRSAATDPEMMSHVVYVSKLRKAFDKDMMKLFFSTHADAEGALKALSKGLVSKGAKQQFGHAPRGGLEREVQEVVDQLTDILGTR
ncbi:unnamed protein product [Polarella glacialis]|uniref:Uncharacterized protein n=1 Tax=Polarella glacialis TaxID=89957 RepID=A0A813LHN4_POLGL|nr:unnamed protein product [Polarella glacialis]